MPIDTKATPFVSPSLAPMCVGYLEQISRMGNLAADFYLRLGQAYPAAPVPARYERGEMRQCYKNAGQLATSHLDLAYCEGYAVRAGLFPMHHAWCLDTEGRVLDTTWPYDPENEYLGVSLSTDFLHQQLHETGVWGVLSEMLPPAIVDSHPDTYLHPIWRQGPPTLNSFWKKFQDTLGRVRPIT